MKLLLKALFLTIVFFTNVFSAPVFIVPHSPGWKVQPIITVGEVAANGYRGPSPWIAVGPRGRNDSEEARSAMGLDEVGDRFVSS